MTSRYEAARLTDAHEFDLIMPRKLTEDELAKIVATGADDYVLSDEEIASPRTRLCFTRAAPTLAEAVMSAIGEVASTGLDIVDVRCFGMTGPDLTALYPELGAIAESSGSTFGAARLAAMLGRRDNDAAEH